MPIQILMPALSPTMEEGTLAKWLVKEGDTVASGDLLAEIETDKATMEFEAVDEGVIGKLLVAEGAEGVAVNAPIAVLLEDGEQMGDMPNAPAPQPVAPNSDASRAPATPVTPTTAPAPAPAAPATAEGTRIFASPLARRIAAENGIDLARISGSGPKGRIVKADLDTARALAPAPSAASTAPATKQSAPKAPQTAQPDAEQVMALYQDRVFEEVKLDGMRKIIAARLTEAKQTIPHFYLRRDIKLDALLKLRSEMNKGLAGRGIKLSVNDYIIKASAMALQEVPDCNAVWAADRILKLTPSDVAVAVAVEGGLFTPVLRDADTKTISALSGEMKDLAARAKIRRLAPHEYQGGSFAISNLGMFGIQNFDAVINPPHGSILAVGAGEKKPIVDSDGQVSVATIMSVTLSVDHRVIDGALGAQFLAAVKRYLEDPIAMLA